MRNVMRGIVALVGLFNIVLGLGFLLDPAGSGRRFFLEAVGTQGLATLRADFTAFFVVGGAFALIGAWRSSAPPLLVPIALLATALIGRAMGLAIDGAAPTAYAPMIAEALMIGILAVATRAFASAR